MNIVQHAEAPVTEITAKSQKAIEDVERLEALMKEEPNQVHLISDHVLHAGVYFRTISMPPGCLVAGAQIKVNSTLIISGDVTVSIEGEPVRFTGYHVLPAHAGRKQAVLAHDYSDLTMVCRTDAKTLEGVEAECVDDVDALGSKKANVDTVQITGV